MKQVWWIVEQEWGQPDGSVAPIPYILFARKEDVDLWYGKKKHPEPKPCTITITECSAQAKILPNKNGMFHFTEDEEGHAVWAGSRTLNLLKKTPEVRIFCDEEGMPLDKGGIIK